MNPLRSIRHALQWVSDSNEIDFLPIRHHLRGYTPGRFGGDARASLNIALLAFPQCMAYAMIAGLPIQFGIYCFIGASLLGPIFASSRFNSYGPSNATSVLVLSSFLALQFPPEQMLLAVPLLVIMAGIFLIVGGYFKVGKLIQYVSRTVITGYITVAALLIITNQIRNVLGYSIEPSASFYGVVLETARNLGATHFPSLLLALATLGVYLALNRCLPKLPNVALTLLTATFLYLGLLHYGYGAGIQTLEDLVLADFVFANIHFSMDWMAQLASAALALALLISL